MNKPNLYWQARAAMVSACQIMSHLDPRESALRLAARKALNHVASDHDLPLNNPSLFLADFVALKHDKPEYICEKGQTLNQAIEEAMILDLITAGAYK